MILIGSRRLVFRQSNRENAASLFGIGNADAAPVRTYNFIGN